MGVELLDGLVLRLTALDPTLKAMALPHILGEVGLQLGKHLFAAGEVFGVELAILQGDNVSHKVGRELVPVDRPADHVVSAVALA